MQLTQADRWLAHLIAGSFAPGRIDRLGVAVSGGGDSMALLHLLAEWGGAELSAVTVDHGLRDGSAAEAAGVAAICARLGVPHDILRWHWDGAGNLSDRARRGRYGVMADWALARGIGAVALGHTADDQAETFLMRLARGAGVDGLSGMAVRRQAHGVEWVRPLLSARRALLRDWLTRRGVAWFDDPSNEDAAYQRVKARAALAALAPLGMDVEAVTATAARLREARIVAGQFAEQAARRIAVIENGDVVFDRIGLLTLPQETVDRLLAQAIRWVATADYRPRFEALTGVQVGLGQRKRRTLGGCLLIPTKMQIRVTREAQAVAVVRGAVGGIWDGRWRVSGPKCDGLHVAALGATGLAQCPEWRAAKMPRSSLLASPAVWRGTELIAAPLAGFGAEWRADLVSGADSFFTSLLSH